MILTVFLTPFSEESFLPGFHVEKLLLDSPMCHALLSILKFLNAASNFDVHLPAVRTDAPVKIHAPTQSMEEPFTLR